MTVIEGICIGVTGIVLLTFWKYQRQVKYICRQLRFLSTHDSNMLISKEIKWGSIEELADLLNNLLEERKKEKMESLRKEQEISDIYTNLSHDIRTPLTSLDGYFQLLETTGKEEDRKRYLFIIQERIESLKGMLEELFTYTKLKNETYRFELTPIKINSVLTTTVFSYYDVWEERGISPQFSIEEEPIWIMGNEQALQRVLQNMIKNVLDYGNKEIVMSLQKEGNMAVLQVKNRIKHGEEIDVSQVFDRFYKADMSRNRTSTGLGLSITKEFVLRMDGKIEASIEGNWFCITIRFKTKIKSQ